MRKMLALPTEQQAACFLASWLTLKGIWFIHVPNEAKRSRIAGYLQKRMGLKPGACDYLIFDSPPLWPEFKGTALELKRSEKEKPTMEQLVFLSEMVKRGWAALVCYGQDDAVKKLEELGYGRTKR